ncbi:hypothetical protein D3C76_1737740 [compost metagenome]
MQLVFLFTVITPVLVDMGGVADRHDLLNAQMVGQSANSFQCQAFGEQSVTLLGGLLDFSMRYLMISSL